jgi:hypothetical protein
MNLARLLVVSLALTLLACGPEAVETVVLSPDTVELEAVLREADARWEAAGVAADRIVIGPGGAPVRVVPQEELRVSSKSKDVAVAVTRVTGAAGTYVGVRWMELSSLDLNAATHEMGHALGVNVVVLDMPHLDGPECDADAAHRPLMCEAVGDVITAQDLDMACSSTDCTHFTPEAG